MQPAKSQWIQVLCEKCLKAKDANCFICLGASFYYWDTESAICYDHKSQAITVEDELGEKINVVRTQPKEKPLELSFLLEYIDAWVKESPLRKWKLSVDESGWHASLWFNRYKKEGCECAGNSLEDCVLTSYQKILSHTL